LIADKRRRKTSSGRESANYLAAAVANHVGAAVANHVGAAVANHVGAAVELPPFSIAIHWPAFLIAV
jgi:hypothetical protein